MGCVNVPHRALHLLASSEAVELLMVVYYRPTVQYKGHQGQPGQVSAIYNSTLYYITWLFSDVRIVRM